MLLEFQYADDCALVADSAENLQSVLNCIDNLYQRLGLSINVSKTEILKFNPENLEPDHQLSIRQEPLAEVRCFKYLGSHISSNCTLDDEVNFRIGKASSAYGRLRARVFENHDISLHTKVMVYHALVISTLLYGSETWTLYRRQIKVLEKFHMRSLQRLLGITWRDKIPHTEVLRKTGCISLESLLNRNKLRWTGHVVRMDNDRLPKQLLYGELAEGQRTVGGQIKRYKDTVRSTLDKCHIPHANLEHLAADRDVWRDVCREGLARFEEDRTQWLCERRERRHQAALQQPGIDHICPQCGRRCASRIGLLSHTRAHQRSRQAEQAVIVGTDGPP